MKTVLITGASQGIGEATAHYFSNNGYKVLLLARNEEKLKKVKAALTGPSEYYVCDISNQEEVTKAAEAITKEEAYLSVIVHNAGIAFFSSFEDTPMDDWTKQFNVNVLGAMMLTQSLLPVSYTHLTLPTICSV